MILDVMDYFWEDFVLWLASIDAVPANDNPGPRNPYEGWGA